MEAVKVGASVKLRCVDGAIRTLRIAEIFDAGEPGLYYVRGHGDDHVIYGAYVEREPRTLKDLESWVKPGELKMQTIQSSNPNFPGWMIYDGHNVLRLSRSTEAEVLAWLAERGYQRHSDYIQKIRGD